MENISKGESEKDPNSAPESGQVLIPTGEKIIFKSELFDVQIVNKHKATGITRVKHYLVVEILEDDPSVEKLATLETTEEVYQSVSIGERVKARLYQQPDQRWTTTPPSLLP